MDSSIQNKKKIIPDYEYSPVRRKVDENTIAWGRALRCVPIAALTFGCTMFFADSFMQGVGFWRLLIYAIMWTVAIGAIFYGGKISLVGAGLTVAYIGIWAAITPGFPNYVINCIRCTLTTAGNLFVSRGYDNMKFLQVGYSAMDEAAVMNASTCFMLTAVLALVFTALNMKRICLIPTALMALLMSAPGITYNFIKTNWGFAFIVLALVAVVVMKMFERCYQAEKEDMQRRASMSGYMGGTVALIAFIFILIPAFATNEHWSEISSISDPINVARDVVTSVISGDMPNLQEMGIVRNMDEQNSRVISPETPNFTGRSMLSIKRRYASSNSPVYLRGWVAAPEFDGKAWYSATNDQTAAYDALFSDVSVAAGYGENYSPDYMTEAFYDILFAPGTIFPEEAGYQRYRKEGFAAYRSDISLELGSGMGNLIYLPSTSMISDGLDVFDEYEPYKGKNDQFYDGMMLTNWFNLNKNYSTTTITANFSSAGSSKNLMTLITYANAVREFLMVAHDDPYSTNLYGAYENSIYAYPELAHITDLIDIKEFYDRYMEMSAEEKEMMYQRYCVLGDKYTKYVYDTYGVSSVYYNTYVGNLANTIRESSSYASAESTHEKVMAVARYIVANYKYTLTPAEGKISGLTALESFIVETKEGYCTHLATTMTLVLRYLGIPARYVEGYLAQEFVKDADGNYTCIVEDKNAHAWVEVYYPGYGWITYEAASTFAKNYYGTELRIPGTSTGETTDPATPTTPSGPSTPDTPDVPIEEPDVIDPEDSQKRVIPWGKIFRIILVIGAIGAGGYLLFRYMKEKADDAVYHRKKMLEEATYGVDKDEYPALSHEINETLLGMLYLSGHIPNQGELPSEYAARFDETSTFNTDRDFAEIMRLMQKQEFGQGTSDVDLRTISEYTSSIWTQLYRGMSKPKKFWYRYILRVV